SGTLTVCAGCGTKILRHCKDRARIAGVIVLHLVHEIVDDIDSKTSLGSPALVFLDGRDAGRGVLEPDALVDDRDTKVLAADAGLDAEHAILETIPILLVEGQARRHPKVLVSVTDDVAACF